ncbi:MAG: hypothetical protein R3F39_07170 [Myxococcota bacterium]
MADDDETKAPTPKSKPAPKGASKPTDPKPTDSAKPEVEAAQTEATGAHPVDFAEQFRVAAQKLMADKLGVSQKADGTLDLGTEQSDKLKVTAQSFLMNLVESLQAGVKPGATAGVTPIGTHPNEGRAANPDAEPASVIDLDEARRRREPTGPSDFEKRIGDSLKKAFEGYMAEHVVPPGATGQVNVNVDPETLKEHGPQLALALFGAFAKALVPESVSVNVPTKAQPAAGATSADGSGSKPTDDTRDESKQTEPAPVQVKLNVDLAGLFRGMLQPKQPKE